MISLSSSRLDERKFGLLKINDIKKSKSKTLIIHYCCESFFNLNGRTPRITSIAIKNRNNNNSVVFSLHLMSQIKQKNIELLTNGELDLIEKEMLKDFYSFVKKHIAYNWIHWNMRNASYGFEAISNRYKILGGKPIKLDDHLLFDLSDILCLIHTNKYEDDNTTLFKGKLLNICSRNNITIKDSINGEQEAIAFQNKDFLIIQMSSMRKVEIIDRILCLQEKNKLKIKLNIIKTCGLTPSGIIEIIRSNTFLFGIWSILFTILGIALEPLIQEFFGTSR